MNSVNKNFKEGNMTFENGILYIKHNPNIIIDENLLYKQFMFRKMLTQEKDIFVIVDLRENFIVAAEALEFRASHPNPEYLKALAIITNFGIDYIRAKMNSFFDETNVKTKIFLSVEEAKDWFSKIKDESMLKNAC